MYPTLGFGLILFGVCVRYAGRPERRFVPLMLSLGLLTMLSGTLGFATGVMKSLNSMQLAADQRYIAWIGVGESLHAVVLALALLALGTLAATFGTSKLASASAKLTA